MQTVRKITFNTSSRQVTLDPLLLRNLNWEIGDYVVIEDNVDHLEIYKLDLSKVKEVNNDRTS